IDKPVDAAMVVDFSIARKTSTANLSHRWSERTFPRGWTNRKSQSLSVKTGRPRIDRVSIRSRITTGTKRSALVHSQISIAPMLIARCPSQNAQRPFFHFLRLFRGFGKSGLEIVVSLTKLSGGGGGVMEPDSGAPISGAVPL